MNYCIKSFKPINGQLTSIYSIHRLVYPIGEWTRAPEGTYLFVSTAGAQECSEAQGDVAYICECEEIVKAKVSIFTELLIHDSENTIEYDFVPVSVRQVQKVFSQMTIGENYGMELTKAVKPIKKIEKVYNAWNEFQNFLSSLPLSTSNSTERS